MFSSPDIGILTAVPDLDVPDGEGLGVGGGRTGGEEDGGEDGDDPGVHCNVRDEAGLCGEDL